MNIIEWKEDEPALLVPMHIEAMVCGFHDNSEYSDIRLRYDHLASEPSGKSLETDPFARTDKYASGVYLHWLLPEGLTHGIQYEEGEEPVYPCVPNRYLITRLEVWENEDGKASIRRKEWLVESDLLQAPPQKTLDALKMARKYSAVGNASDTQKPYRYMGMAREYTEYGNFTTVDAMHQNLTAISTGNPLFSAYYPMCRNVFSFYDCLSDIGNESVKLTYIVSGWYEESTDPLYDAQRTVEEIREELFFKWSGMEDDSRKRHIICHGVISGIEWKGEKACYPSGLHEMALTPSVVLGHSSSEALAAYICHCNQKPEIERVLEGLLEGVLDQWEKLDGFLLAEQKLFRHLFRPHAVVDEIILRGKENMPDASAQMLLDEINQIRRKREWETTRIHGLREEVYLIWCRAVDGESTEEEALQEIERCERKIQEIISVTAQLSQNEEAANDALKQWIEKQPKEAELAFKEIPGQNYWEPNNIVALLEGESQSSIYRKLERYKEDGELPCRTEGELVTELCLEVVRPGEETKESFLIKAETFLPKAAVMLPDILEQLVREGFLQAESCQEYLLLRLTEEENFFALAGDSGEKNYLEYLEQEYEKQMEMEGHVKGKLPNRTAVHQWSPGWNPLFLEWEVEYTPDPELLEDQFTFRNWELGDNGYVCRNPGLYGEQKHKECYSGRSVLSPHALLNLEEQLKRYIGTPCQPMLERLGGAKILSQYLDGMNQQMLGRKSGAVTTIWEGGGKEALNAKAKDLVGNEAVYRQTDRKAYPVRAGCVRLKRMQVVDSFGRAEVYEPDHIIIPERGKIRDNDMEMLLTPQILAPVRIRTEWTYCEVGGKLSPVYGFLWANRFDSCLHIYTLEGKLAGSLQMVYSLKDRAKCRVAFRNPPGEVRKEEELLRELPVALRSFVEALYKNAQNDPQVLYALIQAIDEGIWNTNPAEGKKSEVLLAGLGCPVALAGMRFCVETKEEADHFLCRMRFPVRIGNHVLKGDGTLGFYLIDGKKDYETLYLTADAGVQNEYMQYQPCVECGFSEEKKLALLFLPTQSIHLMTGFIPVKELLLPPEQLQAALAQIYMTLYYGPFLTEKGRLELMVPKALEKEWSFISYDSPGHAREERNISEPMMQAMQGRAGNEICEGWLKLMAQKGHEENEQ